MKRIWTILVLLMLASVAHGTMTYSAGDMIDPRYTGYLFTGNQYLDRHYLMHNEIEGYLEGTTVFPSLSIIESTGATYYTKLMGGNQSANLTLTLPTAYAGVTGYLLSSTDAGVLSWVAPSSTTFTGGTITSATTLDDGVTDSPALVLKDATDETASFVKADAGFLTLTTVAGDGLNVLVGNIKLGNGTPDVAQDGEDAYIEGTLEVDGATQFDGAVAATSTLVVTGMLTANAGLTGDGVAPVTGFTKVVEAHTADDTLLVGESGSVHTNAAAGGTVALTLPAAAAGQTFTFKLMAAQALRITPAAGDAIYIGASAGAAAEYWYADAVGETVTLTAVDATNWIADSYIGTWAQETP
jgi:hypothetical protein